MTDCELLKLLKLYKDKAAPVCGKPRGAVYAEYVALAECHMIAWLAERLRGKSRFMWIHGPTHRCRKWIVGSWASARWPSGGTFSEGRTLFEALCLAVEAGKEKKKP